MIHGLISNCAGPPGPDVGTPGEHRNAEDQSVRGGLAA
jgi:hypothetical protein